MNPVGCNSGWIHLAPFVGGLLSGYWEDSLHQRLFHSQKENAKGSWKWYRYRYYLFKMHSWVWNICKPCMIHQPFLSRFVGLNREKPWLEMTLNFTKTHHNHRLKKKADSSRFFRPGVKSTWIRKKHSSFIRQVCLFHQTQPNKW